eukprot:6096898-Pyramimonas_sp.AAC.1
MERSIVVAPRRNSVRCATRPKALRCDCQRIQKKRAMASRAVSAESDVEVQGGARRHLHYNAGARACGKCGRWRS